MRTLFHGITAAQRSWPWRYGVAILTAAAALLLRFAFDPWLGSHAPYVTYMVAVAVTVWLAGFWPAVLTAALGIPAALVFVIPGSESWLAKAIGIAIYGAGMLVIAWLGRSMRLAQAKVQAAASFQRAVLDILPMKVAVLDGEGIVVAVNQRWPELEIGADYLQFTRRSAQSGEAAAVEAFSCLESVLKGERDEAYLECPSDTPTERQWFLMHVTRASRQVFGGEGALVAYMDITQRKAMEEALRQSETRYRTLFDSIDEGFCIVEVLFDEGGKAVDYRFLEVNPAFPKQTGLADAQGKRMRELAPRHEEYWFETYGRIALTGRSERFQNRAEQLRRWYDVYAFRVGRPEDRHVAILFTDISERRRAEAQLHEAVAELARSNQDLEQFAYVASHDLQEPLRQVAGHLGIVARRLGDKLDPAVRESMEFAVDGAKRMQTLIDDLLAYSRVGRGERDFAQTDMDAALARAMGSLRGAIAEAGAAVTHDRLPAIQAKAPLMAQLLQNLIGNAVKYRSEGRKPEIHVGAGRDDLAWRFWVRDNGIGIPRQDQERVFMVFQRLHSRREYPGTGIGLAICRRIVEHHGGRIWVESEPGVGSTFYFTIPDRA